MKLDVKKVEKYIVGAGDIPPAFGGDNKLLPLSMAGVFFVDYNGCRYVFESKDYLKVRPYLDLSE